MKRFTGILLAILCLAGCAQSTANPPAPAASADKHYLGDTGITYQGSVETGVSARAR